MQKALFNSLFEESILSIIPLSGGCINSAFKIQTELSKYVIKLNKLDKSEMFQKEAMGLNLLKEGSWINIPQVFKTGILENQSFLLLEYVESKNPNEKGYRDLGESLANLHLHRRDANFGLDHNNWIGFLEQKNDPFSDWVEFMVVNRYSELLRMAQNEGLINSTESSLFEKIYQELENLLPSEKPSLLHGDLWNGNALYDQSDKGWLIDPAVYFGHREVDISMTKLFGGFESSFYEAYNDIYPLEKGWEKRIEIHNLYPLLVHLVLFGRSYWNDIKMTVTKYI